LGLDFPFRRRWFREQNPEEVAFDLGSVTTQSGEDKRAVLGSVDFPLKRRTSETMKIYTKMTDKGSLNALGKDKNALGKERLVLM
jgi:hypothetical protein